LPRIVCASSGASARKTGAGCYKYDADRKASPDPEVAALTGKWASEAGIPQRQISPEEIVERCIYTLVNEGTRILEEGIALRAVDIDIIYLNGYGFPAYHGGPMWYANAVGLRKVYERIREFEQRHGAWWTPAPLVRRLAEQGKSFADYHAEQGAAA
jgi:3-hydroxyacyl-CoA dehydrogenase